MRKSRLSSDAWRDWNVPCPSPLETVNYLDDMKAIFILRVAAGLLVATGGLNTVRAESYSIDWSTIDGGGGVSTGGVYQVNGTIGQPDAGAAMTGGNYSVSGGFWS